MAGYHIRNITKGALGEISKIREELEELEDAAEQNCSIMELVELSDMIGAIQHYMDKKHAGYTISDLVKMSDITKRAFTSGSRVDSGIKYNKPNISWDHIYDAMNYYKSLGFNNIDTPWCVSNKAIFETIPENNKASVSSIGYHVGSAEQGFVQMIYENRLELGRWQSTTPCFRDDKENELHSKYFMKLELISLLESDTPFDLAKIAKSFFEKHLNNISIIETEIGFDLITENGIELGSYGYRELSTKQKFVYGTGIAEPRFSIAKNINSLNSNIFND